MTTTVSEKPVEARSRGVAWAWIVAGPVVAVVLFLLVLAGLNAYDGAVQGRWTGVATVVGLVLYAVPLVVGVLVSARGLARLEMPRAWLRLLVALVVVLGGAAILGVLLWLAGLNLQQGSAS